MSKYTAEQVMAKAAHFVADGNLEVAGMLHGYAAHLAAQAEWPSDDDVWQACKTYDEHANNMPEEHAMHAALQSVRPPAPEKD